ncbi:MAG TPA: S24/S26 family peptidase [Roseiflexaceae bacterium]|nr:S24/S26 family peptidase [Roseiflexaceae bacterium]
MIELDRRQLARRATFEDFRRQGARVWIRPRGSSMRPLIGADTLLLVEFGALRPEIGDIILFPLGDIFVAHRLVARRWRQGSEVLIAKGDAEPYFDRSIAPADMLGVVRALRRGGAGRATNLGCAGWTARVVARISYMAGRGAWFGRRAAAILPGPLRRIALSAVSSLARLTAQLWLTPLLWVVLLRAKRIESMEGGEQHEAV